MSEYCASCECLCVHCVFADDTLFLHTALSVCRLHTFVHSVYCVIYKREILA